MMSAESNRWFKSKLDLWLAAVLIAAPLVQIAVLISAVRRGDSEAITASLVGGAIVAAIYGLLVVPVRYCVADDHLLIRFGVVRQRILFDTIVEMYPTHNLLSSAALSIDRLAIKTGRGPFNLTLISPLERDEFISLLASRASLSWDGRRWVRNGHGTSAVRPGASV